MSEIEVSTWKRNSELARLRQLYDAYDEMRKALGIDAPNEIVWHANLDCVREVEVISDGLGKYTTMVYEGDNPNDVLCHDSWEFDTADAAIAKAKELVGDDEDDGPEICLECGEELDTDCDGDERCTTCDGPCPRCHDGG